MFRAVPLLAVLCTGVALGALVVAMISSRHVEPAPSEEAAPLDPTAALPEIAQLRQSRGSVLAGTSLAAGDDAAQFTAALANQSGAELPSEEQSFVVQLRDSAEAYDQQAQRLETMHDYAQADELRRLADEARKVARTLDIDSPAHQR